MQPTGSTSTAYLYRAGAFRIDSERSTERREKAMANVNKQAKKAEAPSTKASNPSADKLNAKKGK